MSGIYTASGGLNITSISQLGLYAPGGQINTNTLVVVIGQSHIPFVMVSSGTMGNNGALSAITAVAATYPNAYVYLPAGAISSGSLAGWYYAVFSTTQAATIYNNTYTSGTPTIPASPTAFVTTGPGAFTQTTGSLITAYALTIPGNTIGPNGSVRITKATTTNSSAGNKIVRDYLNTTEFSSMTTTASLGGGFISGFSNRGVTNVQSTLLAANATTGGQTATPLFGAVDTTTSQSLTIQLELATATDTITLENVVVELIPGV